MAAQASLNFLFLCTSARHVSRGFEAGETDSMEQSSTRPPEVGSFGNLSWWVASTPRLWLGSSMFATLCGPRVGGERVVAAVELAGLF